MARAMATDQWEVGLPEIKTVSDQNGICAVFLLAGSGITELASLRQHQNLLSLKPITRPDDKTYDECLLVVLSLTPRTTGGRVALAKQAIKLWQQEHARNRSKDNSELDYFGMLVSTELVTETCRQLSSIVIEPQQLRRLNQHTQPLILDQNRLSQNTRWLLAVAAGAKPMIPANTDLQNTSLSEADWYGGSFPYSNLTKLLGGINALWDQRSEKNKFLTVVNVKVEIAVTHLHAQQRQQRDYLQLLKGIDNTIRMNCNRRISTRSCYAGAGEFTLSLPSLDHDDATNLVQTLSTLLRESTKLAVSADVRDDFKLTIGSASGHPSKAMPMWMFSQLADLNRFGC